MDKPYKNLDLDHKINPHGATDRRKGPPDRRRLSLDNIKFEPGRIIPYSCGFYAALTPADHPWVPYRDRRRSIDNLPEFTFADWMAVNCYLFKPISRRC